jgi:hypothetical protein
MTNANTSPSEFSSPPAINSPEFFGIEPGTSEYDAFLALPEPGEGDPDADFSLPVTSHPNSKISISDTSDLSDAEYEALKLLIGLGRSVTAAASTVRSRRPQSDQL